MAKRRSDPRVVTSALPPLARLKRKTSANADMNLRCRLEKCQHTTTTDGVTIRCDNAPIVTYTKNGTGTIGRYCSQHFAEKNERAATQAELDMILRWALARMSSTTVA